MIRLIVLMALALMLAPTAQAQEPAGSLVLHVRALVDPLPERIVRTIAEEATPTYFYEASQPGMQAWSLRLMVQTLCGSIQPGYLESITDLGGQIPDLDAPLGPRAYDIEWPACLRISRLTNISAFVRQGDLLGTIKKRFTGDGISNIDAFFAGTGLSTVDAKELQPGREIAIPYATSETRLEARFGDLAAFAKKLETMGQAELSVKLGPRPAGTIIVPLESLGEQSPGSIQNSFSDCIGGGGRSDYPFDPMPIVYAYTEMLKRIHVRSISVLAIDNGFFGVPLDGEYAPPGPLSVAPGDPLRFPRDMFVQRGLAFGPRLNDFWPVNYANLKDGKSLYGPGDVTNDSGHGTHVAGLILGGPAFEPKERRALFYDRGSPWLNLVIGNLSGGRREIPSGMETSLIKALDSPSEIKVVNMSVAFDAKTYPDVISTLQTYLGTRPGVLFVAAAGNRGQPLDALGEQPYPAMLAGKIPNVITIASVDAPGADGAHLSSFSNRGNAVADLAAPGCKILSWLDAGLPPVPMSGTSQAAPIVSFAAALLRSVWKDPPAAIRIRLMASGDLLAKEDQGLVRSGSQLNIAKALTFDRTRITFERDGVRRVLLGDMTASLQGVACNQQKLEFAALKRRSLTESFVVFVASGGEFQTCQGKVPANRKVSFKPIEEVDADGKIGPAGPLDTPITTSELIEIVRAY